MAQKKRLDSAASHKNRIEEFRGRMPVQEASARVGTLYGTWYKWERGDSFPTLPFIWRLEELFSGLAGTDVSYRDIWPGIDPTLSNLDDDMGKKTTKDGHLT